MIDIKYAAAAHTALKSGASINDMFVAVHVMYRPKPGHKRNGYFDFCGRYPSDDINRLCDGNVNAVDISSHLHYLERSREARGWVKVASTKEEMLEMVKPKQRWNTPVDKYAYMLLVHEFGINPHREIIGFDYEPSSELVDHILSRINRTHGWSDAYELCQLTHVLCHENGYWIGDTDVLELLECMRHEDDMSAVYPDDER